MSVVLEDISDEVLPLFAQVMFKDKPLSYYLFKMEGEGNTPQTPPEDDLQHCRAAASPKALTTGLLFQSADLPCPGLSSTYILPLTFPSFPSSNK